MAGNPNHDDKGKFSSNATHGGGGKDTSVQYARDNNGALKISPKYSDAQLKTIRLNQLLYDKRSTKKAGHDVEGSDYAHYNSQIRTLRSEIKASKSK